jgi:hypothetical protein
MSAAGGLGPLAAGGMSFPVTAAPFSAGGLAATPGMTAGSGLLGGLSSIQSFLGQHLGAGSGINDFLRGVGQGYGLPLGGGQGFGMNATTFGRGLAGLMQRPDQPMPPMPPPPQRNMQFQQLLNALAQQRNRYALPGAGGMF